MTHRVNFTRTRFAGLGFGIMCALFLPRAETHAFTMQDVAVEPESPFISLLEKKLPSLSTKEHRKLTATLLELCQRYEFSPAFILGLIHVESDFQTDVESIAGAVGLMQVLPSTAEPIAKKLALPWRGKETLQDPLMNLRIGFHYLDYLRSRFGHSREYVTAYNWGPTRVVGMLQNRQRLPLDYFKKIERTQKEYAFLDKFVAL